MEEMYAKRTYGIKRLFRKILFHIATNMPFLKAEFRAKIHKVAGVNIVNTKNTFIGYGVFFHKELIRNPQVSPSHLFNKAEIMELMKNADDRHYNTLVIDENGF